MKIEELDYNMKVAIERQIELGARDGVCDICIRLINDMIKGNFNNITRKCRPFFQSMDIGIVLQGIMGTDLESSKYLFSKRMESLIKNNQISQVQFQQQAPNQNTHINKNLENISIKADKILNLPLNNLQKTSLFTCLYYGNDNYFIRYLQEPISSEEMKIALIKNCLDVSILSTNTSGEWSKDERIIYEGLMIMEMENILITARDIISKLLGFESKQRNDSVSINSRSIISNINNLNDVDINFLAQLYMMTRRDHNTRKIMETASYHSYDIDDINRCQYMNTQQLLGIVHTEQFYSDLRNSYHK